jgi:hypothetical protein
MAHCSFCEMSEEQAREQERDRIIKLLEEQTDHACPDCLDRAINDAIALIKGENK